MNWFALLLVGAVISGNEARMEELKPLDLQYDVLAKGMMLQETSVFIQTMYNKGTNEEGEEEVQSITKKAAKTDTQVIAALYDRYMGLLLVINFYACLHFYKQGAAAPEKGEAEGCKDHAEYIHWFNDEFTPGEFLKQLKDPGPASDAKYNIVTVVEKLEILFKRQKQMVEAFENTANVEDPREQYADVFKYLRQMNPKMPPDQGQRLVKLAVQRGQVENEFREAALIRFYTFYDEELLYVHSYWNLFFAQAAKRPIVTDPSQLVRDPLVEEDVQRSHFKLMEDSNLNPKEHDFQNVHEIQYAALLHQALEMRVRDIPEVLPPEKWKITPSQPGSLVDFFFEFLEERKTATTEGGAASASGTAGADVLTAEGFSRLAGSLQTAAGSSEAT